MSTPNNMFVSLADILSPSTGQIVPLKLVWNNPNPKPGKRKFRANLRLVYSAQPKRAA